MRTILRRPSSAPSSKLPVRVAIAVLPQRLPAFSRGLAAVLHGSAEMTKRDRLTRLELIIVGCVIVLVLNYVMP